MGSSRVLPLLATQPCLPYGSGLSQTVPTPQPCHLLTQPKRRHQDAPWSPSPARRSKEPKCPQTQARGLSRLPSPTERAFGLGTASSSPALPGLAKTWLKEAKRAAGTTGICPTAPPEGWCGHTDGCPLVTTCTTGRRTPGHLLARPESQLRHPLLPQRSCFSFSDATQATELN